MRTTPDTDRKQLRRPRRLGLGWYRWLLYPLIAVSAYLLVALAKAVPDPAGVAGVADLADMTSYMAERMVAKTSANDLSVEQLALEEKMRAHASSSEADHAGFHVFHTGGAMSRCLLIPREGRESRPRRAGIDRDEVRNRR